MDYKAHPESIAERRAISTGDPTLWTPRDVLINMLREVDGGNFPGLDLLVISYHYTPPGSDDDDGRIAYKQAGSSKYASVGLLACTQHLMMGVESDG
jgi:hypothetical protein